MIFFSLSVSSLSSSVSFQISFIVMSFHFFFLIHLFIYLFIFGCVGSLLLHMAFLQLRRVGATLRCAARTSHHSGFSCCGAWALGTRASVAVACRLSNCGAWAQLLRGMWDLPGPGIEPVSPALAGRFLTTVPPGMSHLVISLLTYLISFRVENICLYFSSVYCGELSSIIHLFFHFRIICFFISSSPFPLQIKMFTSIFLFSFHPSVIRFAIQIFYVYKDTANELSLSGSSQRRATVGGWKRARGWFHRM